MSSKYAKLINAYASTLPNANAKEGKAMWNAGIFSHKDKAKMARAMKKHLVNIAKAGGKQTRYSKEVGATNAYTEHEKAHPGNALLKGG